MADADTPTPPAGWYPDPNGPPGHERWWDASNARWGDWTRQTPGQPAPHRGVKFIGRPRSWALLSIAVVAALLWLHGSFDRLLSDVGLNTQTCATNAFGVKFCGKELTAFCKQHYDPSINADTCDSVLSDAGIDPQQLQAEQKRAEAAQSAQQDQQSESNFAGYEDSDAKRDIRTTESAVELCYTRRQDYFLCQRESQLGYPSAIIGHGQGETEIAALSSGSYQVIGHSSSGTDFTSEHGETGAVTRTCSKPDFGGCKPGGTW